MLGQIRLRQIFNLEKDRDYVYNLTVVATDQGGLSNFTNVVIILNIISMTNLNMDSLFECTLSGAKSEIDSNDQITLNPPLFITVRKLIRKIGFKIISL